MEILEAGVVAWISWQPAKSTHNALEITNAVVLCHTPTRATAAAAGATVNRANVVVVWHFHERGEVNANPGVRGTVHTAILCTHRASVMLRRDHIVILVIVVVVIVVIVIMVDGWQTSLQLVIQERAIRWEDSRIVGSQWLLWWLIACE